MKREKLQVGLCITAMVSVMLFFTVSMDASAQFGRGGPQLAPEKLEAAWALEAKGVANELTLSENSAAKLAGLYKEARESHQKGMQELFAGGGGGMGRMQGMRDLNEKERAALEKALQDVLSAEQSASATKLLGTFNRQWDRLVDTLAAFELEDEKLFPALKLVNRYVVDSDKARSEAMANMDFESMRTVSQELKAKLDSSLAETLSEEQLAKWKEATARRGGRGGGFGGGGHGDGQGTGHN